MDKSYGRPNGYEFRKFIGFVFVLGPNYNNLYYSKPSLGGISATIDEW